MKSIPIRYLPQLTTSQMVKVDRLMIEEWHISLIQMMENAGRNLAELARYLLGGRVHGKQVILLCGMGNNGGGGMVSARHLHNRGAQVRAILTGSPKQLKEVPRKQWKIIQKMGLVCKDADLNKADLILDAMIGYGLVGSPRPIISDWIIKANTSSTKILALDAPTGLNTTIGLQSDRCIQAAATLTLAMPKIGLLRPGAELSVGDLFLADISVPPELYASPSLSLQLSSPFDEGMIVRLIK